MSARATARRSRTLLMAAALSATAALTLTACGGGDDSASDKAGSSGPADTASPAKDEEAAAAAKDGRSGSAAGSSDKGKSAAPGVCASGTVKVEVKAVSRPVNHLLVVATNTSKAACTAHGYPFLRFDQDQATTPVIDKSRPQAPVTLAPGKSAYAGIVTSAADGSGGTGRKAKKLAVSFQGPGDGSTVGDKMDAPLPGGSVHVDDQAQGTYWQSSQADALKW
ncbi:DUF4232 domain-containing protein [Streptomyces netropsis]|uniref:DUF4232 domain-containing protein n=1 Tax=Streptomyces netropsis TaxID=55404 RepID=A0A7W7LCF1_STRNE|nr:DUF4232 domain-containing protein [Streptomyces netropsis]MBB4887648.1 hypothetical protein [Streptomyces netropsis]GGR34315.1 hypothetical protein GCM10010219_44070 [Streptomyces netropsis]